MRIFLGNRGGFSEQSNDTSPTVVTDWKKGIHSGVCLILEEDIMSQHYVIRRLTPLECERLQAFPDNWTLLDGYTDDKGRKRKCTDSNRYAALGNSIAVCAWTDILQSIARLIPDGEEKTLGSLFDGIGGFPLTWQRDCGGRAVWASEIEPFCIAVTKKHFGED